MLKQLPKRHKFYSDDLEKRNEQLLDLANKQSSLITALVKDVEALNKRLDDAGIS
tara:strand:- start:1523 stop:1687 length:165 start_codon:yes stop_codon:yes gene_type:complete